MLSYTFSEAALETAFRFILMRNGEQGTFSQESDMNKTLREDRGQLRLPAVSLDTPSASGFSEVSPRNETCSAKTMRVLSNLGGSGHPRPGVPNYWAAEQYWSMGCLKLGCTTEDEPLASE